MSGRSASTQKTSHCGQSDRLWNFQRQVHERCQGHANGLDYQWFGHGQEVTYVIGQRV